MSPGMLGISDQGIMIHLFFLHLPTQKRCWSFFISLGRKAREGLDSIFQGEHARCIPHILLASSSEVVSSLSRPRPASLDQPQPASKKHTHKSYIIIPGKTPLTQDCSFFSQLLGQGHAPVNSQFSQQRLLHFRVWQNVLEHFLCFQGSKPSCEIPKVLLSMFI